MNLCKDCKFYRTVYYPRPETHCVKWAGTTHPVSGGATEHVEVTAFRLSVCGWDEPRFFEKNTSEASE